MKTTADLRAYLEAEFPHWHIIDETRQLDGVSKPTVLIYPDEIRRVNSAGNVLTVHTQLTVWLLTEKVKPDEVEAELDSNIFPLLGVIEKASEFTWENVTRATLAGAGHGYQLTVNVIFQITEI